MEQYTVKNRTAHAIGLFNRITGVRADGTLDVSPDLAYIELQDELLVVRKLALPIPEGLSMTAYVPPYASEVAASAVFVEQIILTLPVRVMQPFKRALLPGQVVADRPAQANSARLEIGHFPIHVPLTLLASNPAHPELLSVMPPGAALSHQQVFSQDFELREPIPVLDYRAVPWP